MLVWTAHRLRVRILSCHCSKWWDNGKTESVPSADEQSRPASPKSDDTPTIDEQVAESFVSVVRMSRSACKHLLQPSHGNNKALLSFFQRRASDESTNPTTLSNGKTESVPSADEQSRPASPKSGKQQSPFVLLSAARSSAHSPPPPARRL
jgi:hypothetical protein